MRLTFWKVSQGPAAHFAYEGILESLSQRLVYVHKDTKAKARSKRTQAQDFIEAPTGDYFYLTHGNEGIYVLGQFSGPANVFSSMGNGWLDRPFRLIKSAICRDTYRGPHKRWAPNDHSTFTLVPASEVLLFEEHILQPYFGITLAKFAIK